MSTKIVKQTEIRANIKKYLDAASAGDILLVPRIAGKNVVILSEEKYYALKEKSSS